MKKFSTFFTVLLTLSLVFAFAGDARQAFMEKSPGKFDPAAYLQVQQEKFNWLLTEAVPLSEKSIIPIYVTSDEIDAINNYKCETCGNNGVVRYKERIGIVKPVSFDVSRLPYKPTADGGFVWTAAAESKTATALRVYFTNFSLPDNAAVYIYNMDGEVFGPYTGRGPGDEGDFWSNTITGPITYIQIRHFGPASQTALKSINFKIAGVGHMGEKFLLPFYQHQKSIEGIYRTLTHCPENEDCVEDASCFSGGAINDAKHAAAYIQWVAGAWIYMCSGGLIADTDDSSQIPYFLTANHCISSKKNAKNLEAYFQFWTASCHGACYDPVGVCPRTLGSDIIHTSRNGDHSLLQLWEDPPGGSVFLGWNATPLAFEDGTHLFRISHPSGMPQAYSEHVVDSDYVECGGLPVGEFIYSQDVVGATEGGSSGSPVMNMSGQIVGQLYGGCGYNINDVCDSEQNRTVDGAFAFYFDDVKQWLDPDGGGGTEMHVQSIVLSVKQKGPKADAIAKVIIVDEYNNPVEDAEVTGTFTGDANGTTSAATGADGEATLKINVQGTVTNFTFCVDSVTHATLTYNPDDNVETCDTYGN